MLNVTEGHLSRVVARIDSLDDPVLRQLNDRDAFDFLDRTLYVDDDRSGEQVARDAERVFKFDFLTNGGGSFDQTKSFILRDAAQLRILFTDRSGTFHAAHIGLGAFLLTTEAFFAWISGEEKNAG